MTVVQFEILSDESFLFNVDSLAHANQYLNYNITQDQCSTIISKINRRIKEYKFPTNLLYSIGFTIIIILVLMTLFILGQISKWNEDSASYFVGGLYVAVFCLIICCVCACSGICNKYNRKNSEKHLRQLQVDIQRIADEELRGTHGILSSKWIMEKIGDRMSGKRFKLTARFHLPQAIIPSVPVHSVREPIDFTSIRLDPPTRISAASTLGIDLEQFTTSLHNEQDAQYVTATAIPSPPSYSKAVDLFSKGIFRNCPHCSSENCVFNEKYCTLCGHSFVR